MRLNDTILLILTPKLQKMFTALQMLALFPGPAQLSVAISFSALQATKSWAGLGNEASKCHVDLKLTEFFA